MAPAPVKRYRARVEFLGGFCYPPIAADRARGMFREIEPRQLLLADTYTVQAFRRPPSGLRRAT